MSASLDPAWVDAVLEDHRSVDMPDRLRTTLDFVEKMVLDPQSLDETDVQAMRDAGVTEQQMDHAVQIAFMFGIMDRLADAFDFDLSDERALRWIPRILLGLGYRIGSIPG